MVASAGAAGSFLLAAGSMPRVPYSASAPIESSRPHPVVPSDSPAADLRDGDGASRLAGGVNIGIFSGFSFPVLSRNLTPHEGSGLRKDEDEFFEIMLWGVDFARPGGSLRIEPHFPSEFRFTDDDLSVRAEYNGRFSDDSMEHGGFLKVQYNF